MTRVHRLPVDAFFLEGKHRCYACLHHAGGQLERSASVVVVSPIGQENLRSHRALRAISDGLARLGYYNLRVDLFGTGNSEGVDRDVALAIWLENIAAAVEWLRTETGMRRVGLVGLRLSATLAALYGAASDTVDALAMWNPVVNGAAYIEELRADHARFGGCTHADDEPVEYLGFEYTPLLLAELRAIELAKIPRAPAHEIMILESGPLDPDAPRCFAWPHKRVRVSGPNVWSRLAGPPAICSESTRAVVDWAAKVLP